MASKETIAIVGSGWAGYNLSHALNTDKYSVVVISPEATSSLTPLPASAACGLFNCQLAQEPIRRQGVNIKYIKAFVDDIDFGQKLLSCTPAFELLNGERMEIAFDKVVVAPGCKVNYFNTPGVEEHAFIIKNADDANAIRCRLNAILEMASLPCTSEARQRELLHIVVVGGGPTGIEIAAELMDLFDDELGRLYPHLRGKATVSVHDVAPSILAPFDNELSEYATSALRHRKVEVKVTSHISQNHEECIERKEDGKIACGMLIWATGNTQSPFVERLNVLKPSHGMQRILTDDRSQVLDASSSVISGAYALGDAADIDGGSLPTTAEVAVQKADYLASCFNRPEAASKPFHYTQRELVTYTGAGDGVVQGKGGHEYTGYSAWLSWRAGNLLWTRSWRRKVVMCLAWVMDWIDGREISRR